MTICRLWCGVAPPGPQADAYLEHLSQTVFPALSRIPGHEGGEVLARETEAGIEFLVLTRWESLDSIRAFAGDEPDRAVVEAQARAVLSEFDNTVSHYALVDDLVDLEASAHARAMAAPPRSRP